MYGPFGDLDEKKRTDLLADFDIMVKQSYDVWTLVVVLPYEKERMQQLQPIAYEDENGLGVNILRQDQTIHIKIFCTLDHQELYFSFMDDDTRYFKPSAAPLDPYNVLSKLLAGLKPELLSGITSTLENIVHVYKGDTLEEVENTTDIGCDFLAILDPGP